MTLADRVLSSPTFWGWRAVALVLWWWVRDGVLLCYKKCPAHIMCYMKGRPPLDPKRRRSEVLRTRVRPEGAKAFRDKAQGKGLTESQALRQALDLWMRSN